MNSDANNTSQLFINKQHYIPSTHAMTTLAIMQLFSFLIILSSC